MDSSVYDYFLVKKIMNFECFGVFRERKLGLLGEYYVV